MADISPCMRRVSERPPPPQLLAAPEAEAPLLPDPHIALSGEQSARPEIRAHHGAPAARSYGFVGRLPSRARLSAPSKRGSRLLELSPRWKTQARFPEGHKLRRSGHP